MGVNGFLISWAMIRAISAQAARRLERTTSETSSITAIRAPGSAERQRHRHDAPPLAGPGLELFGDGRAADALEDLPDARASPRPERPRRAWRRRACRRQSAGRRGVGEEHAPVLAVGHHTGRELGEQRREAFLLARERIRLLLEAPRHVEEGAHELAQLLVGRLGEMRREVAAGDGPGPLDQVGHGPRDAHGQAPRDRRGHEKHEER